MSGNSALEERYPKAIGALMSTMTVRAAANQLDINEGTLYKWLSDPVLSDAYKEARYLAVQHAIAMLSKSASGAVIRLNEILNDASQPGSVQVAAARTILEFAMRGMEAEQLRDRLEALEKAQEQQYP